MNHKLKFFVFALCSVFLLTFCACSDEKKDTPQETAQNTASDTTNENSTLKVGFVYVSPIGDAGYSYAHEQGRQAVIANCENVKTSFVESVKEGADSERVIRNMANDGYELIFSTSFGYMDPTKRVANEFPNIAFMHCSGFKTAPNMNNYFGRMYQARYLTGLVAGAMTKSAKIGYVAAFPIPEVIRGINAFTLGVQKVNPKAEVRVVWTKTWYDPALEKDAAISLLDVGCDIIAQHQDSPGPQEAAQERDVYSIGYNSDMSGFAPKSHLTAAVWNWGPFYTKTVKQIQDGTWKGEQSLWLGMNEGVVDIAPLAQIVPEETKQLVKEKRDAFIAGEDTIFVGPIKNQAEEIVVPEGKQIDDTDLLNMNYFIQGVIGNTN